jgi:hypothetical protein
MSETEEQERGSENAEKPANLLQPGETVEDAIARIVNALQGEELGLFRTLCAIGLRYHLEPSHFRSMLLRAKLREERASELKIVLEKAEICARFVDEALTWHEALTAARLGSFDPIQFAVSAFVTLLINEGHLWATSQEQDGWILERGSDDRFVFCNPEVGSLEVQTFV